VTAKWPKHKRENEEIERNRKRPMLHDTASAVFRFSRVK
jgi:hypothetical protein